MAASALIKRLTTSMVGPQSTKRIPTATTVNGLRSMALSCLRVGQLDLAGPQTNCFSPTPTGNNLQLVTATIRAFSTTPALYFRTRKRRKRHPFFWLQDKERKFSDEKLTTENEKFYQEFLAHKYQLTDGASPLKAAPWPSDEPFTNGSSRTGVIAKKLGVYEMWDKNGRKMHTTLLQVCDNHVIKYHSPEVFQKHGRPLDVRRFAGMACMIVGAESRDPRRFTAEYNGLFEDAGVMSKQKLTRFFVTPNARLEPGTPIMASHFRPGMFVDVYGKSREWGLQGVRFRHQFKGGPKTHGSTKFHNRPGSIGRGRKHCGPLKGKKMAGFEGGDRALMRGLRVWRVNTKYNLLYVQGLAVPGPEGAYVNVMDSRIFGKTPSEENPPPWPTATVEEHNKLDEELWDPTLHRPDEPTIIFQVSEEERRAAEVAARRLGYGKTAQKHR